MPAHLAAHLLDGKTLALDCQNKIKNYILANNLKHKINLAVILIGNDPASKIYVQNKQIACNYVFINTVQYFLSESITEQELLELIKTLNQDPKTHGILLQLPLPKHLAEPKILSKILSSITPNKDVDGFNPHNMGLLAQKSPNLRPCTPKGIMKLLEHYNISPRAKNVTIVGASNIVGRPLALEMLTVGATVTICHKLTADLKMHCVNADIICSAVGKPNLIKQDYVKPGAIVIDIGITRLPNGTICGDVDFEQAKKIASYITPVPGGVGPMTVAMLLENTIECYRLGIM